MTKKEFKKALKKILKRVNDEDEVTVVFEGERFHECVMSKLTISKDEETGKTLCDIYLRAKED